MKHFLRLIATVGLGAGLTACAVETTPHGAADCGEQNAGQPTALVVAAHANFPAVDVSADALCRVEAAVDAGEPIVLVGVDGTPEVELDKVFELNEANDTVRSDSVGISVRAVRETIGGLEADADGADLEGAIAVAVDALRARGANTGNIVVSDSGLADSGGLQMTAPGMLGADPAEVAEFFATTSGIEATGYTVTFESLGYAAGTQPPLSKAHRHQVEQLWAAAVGAVGATVEVTSRPVSGEGPSTEFTVAPVELPERPEFSASGTVYDQSSPLAFVGDSTRFVDERAARREVRSLANWLKQRPGQRIRVVGTTASAGSEQGRLRLSRARAARVKALLVEAGVASARVETTGVGTHFREFTPDRRDDGSLDPSAAATNRTTRIDPLS